MERDDRGNVPRATYSGFHAATLFLRRLLNADAYERYLTHHAAHHPSEEPLTAREFHARETERKWSGVRRCC